MSIDLNKSAGTSISDLSLLAENLRYLMEIHNMDAATLGDKTGVALTTINSLKRGVGNPTISTLLSLANFFGVSLSEFAETKISAKNKRKKIFDIPLIELGQLESFLTQKKSNEFMSSELDTQAAGSCFAIKISNNGILPFFEKGTIFIIDPTKIVHDGDMVLVKFKDTAPCFRKIFIEANSYFFKQISDLISQNITKGDDYHIYGIVIKAVQQFS